MLRKPYFVNERSVVVPNTLPHNSSSTRIRNIFVQPGFSNEGLQSETKIYLLLLLFYFKSCFFLFIFYTFIHQLTYEQSLKNSVQILQTES